MSLSITIQSEDLLALIAAALNADYTSVRQVANRLAASAAEADIDVAKQIKTALRRSGVPLRASGYSESLPVDPKSRSPLIEEQPWPITPGFLDEDLQNVFQAFIRDAKNIEKLQAHGLSGKMNIIMSGPPGTGKSLIAGHIASQLQKPFYVVRLDSLVSSLLGDTAKNIRNVFDYVSNSNGVLFLDEFDAIAKIRDDKNELGELKRVVNTLIQGIDSLDDRAIIIAATNHADLLDPAIWRRFPYKMDFSLPGQDLRKALWAHFLFQDKADEAISSALAKISESLTGAEIESISTSARRQSILSGQEIDIAIVALSITNIKSGLRTSTIKNQLSAQERRTLGISLIKNHNLGTTEASKLVGVSRQTISTHLKE